MPVVTDNRAAVRVSLNSIFTPESTWRGADAQVSKLEGYARRGSDDMKLVARRLRMRLGRNKNPRKGGARALDDIYFEARLINDLYERALKAEASRA